MKTKYILTHTPREIAVDYMASDILRELYSRTPDTIISVADLFSDGSPANFLDMTPNVDDAKGLLDGWYEAAPEERPCDPETLAVIMALYAAWQHAASLED